MLFRSLGSAVVTRLLHRKEVSSPARIVHVCDIVVPCDLRGESHGTDALIQVDWRLSGDYDYLMAEVVGKRAQNFFYKNGFSNLAGPYFGIPLVDTLEKRAKRLCHTVSQAYHKIRQTVTRHLRP